MVLKGWKKLIKGERKTSTWKHLQKPRSDQTSVLDVGLGKKQSLPTDYNGSKTQQKKQIVTQGKEYHKNEVMEAGVQPRQGQWVFMLELSGAWELPDSSIAWEFSPGTRSCNCFLSQDMAAWSKARWNKKKITYGGVLYVGKFGSRLLELTCLKPKLLIRFIVNKTC